MTTDVAHWIVTVLALLAAVAALVIALRFPGIGIQAPALGGSSGYSGCGMTSCGYQCPIVGCR